MNISSPINPVVGSVILIAVFDGIVVSETFESTSYSFILIDGISFGYRYIGDDKAGDALSRVYASLFDEALKELRAENSQFML
jgi:hypothetical protein